MLSRTTGFLPEGMTMASRAITSCRDNRRRCPETSFLPGRLASRIPWRAVFPGQSTACPMLSIVPANQWRKIAHFRAQIQRVAENRTFRVLNALKTFQQPPLISKCTFYRHRITLPKEPPATPLGLVGRCTVPAPTHQSRYVNPATLAPSLHYASCAGFGSTPSKKARISSRLTGQYSLASTPTS